MPIRNYTSKVSAGQSIAKIMKVLSRVGAARVSVSYGPDGEETGIEFEMFVGETIARFHLTPDEDCLLDRMRADREVPGHRCTPEQARRTAWKNLHDWIDAQLAMVDAGQADVEQLFLGYVVMNSGERLYDRILREPGPRLTLDGGGDG